MRDWIRRIFRRPRRDARSGDSPCDDPLAACRRLLLKHVRIQTDKARSNGRLVPRRFVDDCDRVFARHVDDIAARMIASVRQETPQNYGYQDAESGIYMVVSVMPWTTEEAVRKLAEFSSERPFGYVAMMTNLFINNWPSADLAYFFHVLICLGGDLFKMHTAMGDYGGFPKAQREFTVFPVELLNDEERRMVGL
jgi:hypothetical protein